jgi:SulP family sulfate permease
MRAESSRQAKLEAIDHRLASMGVMLHLSEVKGRVTDKLARTSFLDRLSGQLFLTQHQAVATLTAGATIRRAG